MHERWHAVWRSWRHLRRRRCLREEAIGNYLPGGFVSNRDDRAGGEYLQRERNVRDSIACLVHGGQLLRQRNELFADKRWHVHWRHLHQRNNHVMRRIELQRGHNELQDHMPSRHRLREREGVRFDGRVHADTLGSDVHFRSAVQGRQLRRRRLL